MNAVTTIEDNSGCKVPSPAPSMRVTVLGLFDLLLDVFVPKAFLGILALGLRQRRLRIPHQRLQALHISHRICL